MTNDPSYDQQLALLKTLDFSKPIERHAAARQRQSARPLPARVLLSLHGPEARETEREGVASILAIARNVSVPFGAPYKSFGVYNTEYRTVTDATNGLYFFELTTSPSVIWTDLKKLNFEPGAPVRDAQPQLDRSGRRRVRRTIARLPRPIDRQARGGRASLITRDGETARGSALPRHSAARGLDAAQGWDYLMCS